MYVVRVPDCSELSIGYEQDWNRQLTKSDCFKLGTDDECLDMTPERLHSSKGLSCLICHSINISEPVRPDQRSKEVLLEQLKEHAVGRQSSIKVVGRRNFETTSDQPAPGHESTVEEDAFTDDSITSEVIDHSLAQPSEDLPRTHYVAGTMKKLVLRSLGVSPEVTTLP